MKYRRSEGYCKVAAKDIMQRGTLEPYDNIPAEAKNVSLGEWHAKVFNKHFEEWYKRNKRK